MERLLDWRIPLIQFLRITSRWRCRWICKKRFPIYHVCPKCLAAFLCGAAIRKNASTSLSGIGWGGNDTGRLVTCEFPLLTDSASWKSLESLIQFTSFFILVLSPDNSIMVFWSSMSLRLEIVSKVELWNFCNSSISVRLCWWASRNSNFCRHNCSCRSRRSSPWAAWSSWWAVFSQYSAIIICLCSSSKVLICPFELFRSSGFPYLSTTFSAWVFSENLLWALYVYLVTPKPIDWSTFLSPAGFLVLSNTTDDDYWLTDTPSGSQ